MNKVRILIFGDISLMHMNEKSFSYGPIMQRLIRNSDLVVGNLECPITSSKKKKPYQAVNLFADSSKLSLLNDFTAVSLANNHIQDYGNEGIVDTIKALDACHISHFGVGATKNDALEPFLAQCGYMKLAIFGATRYANANKNEWGTASDDSVALYKKIKEYKQKGYFVIVFMHWGYEYVRIPSPRERRIGHRCIDSGADFVIGSHPHIYQGIEEYKGKSIVYSLGNAIFHSSVFEGLSFIPNDPRLFTSYAINLAVDSELNYQVNVFGYHTSNKEIELLVKEGNERIKKDIAKISSPLQNGISWLYLKEYYSQTANISRQNVKVRNQFQHAKRLSLKDRLALYMQANSQDIKNRIWGLISNLFNER